MLKEIFIGSKPYDDKTDDETNDDQPDTTDMPESVKHYRYEESAKQGNKKEQELKILTLDQMLSRVPNS